MDENKSMLHIGPEPMEVVLTYPPQPKPVEVVLTYPPEPAEVVLTYPPQKRGNRAPAAEPAGQREAAPQPPAQTLPSIEELRDTARRQAEEAILDARDTVKKKRRSHKWVWVLLLAVLLLGAVGIVIWSSMSGSPASAEGGDAPPVEEAQDITIPLYRPDSGNASMEIQTNRNEPMAIQDIYAKINPAVVTVLSHLEYGASLGTGIIFTEDGYVCTNYHVLSGGSSCTLTLASGEVYEAKYVGGDENADIAVLKMEGDNFPMVEIGDSDALSVGDTVYAIGNPLGVELRGTLTDGIVSAINRNVKVEGRTMTLIQTNAALNQGNSGGPLVNVYGQVVGINTVKMMSLYASIEGLGFAIPTSSVCGMVNDILRCGEVLPEPALGVVVSTVATALADGTLGIEVLDLTPGFPAADAGVEIGDVIVSAAGQSVTGSRALLRIRREFNVGDEMEMMLWRDGEYRSVTLELDEAA